MEAILINIIVTIISGLAFTLTLFLIKEYILPNNNISGEWTSTIKIIESSYNPYKNLKIEFKIHLLQNSNEVLGFGEKVRDIKPDGSKTVFERAKRVKLEITGYYERKYTRKSKVFLNIVEKGRERDSLATYTLIVKNSKLMKGVFRSTAADSSGEVTMKQDD